MNDIQRKYFIGVIFILELVYIGFELALNASIVNISSGLIYSPSLIDKIQHYGRTVSGCGLALTIFSFLYRYVATLKFRLLAMGVCLAVCIPFMHGLQSLIVNRVVAQHNNGAIRARSELLVSYRDGMKYRLYGMGPRIPINNDTKSPLSNDDVTFLAIFPLLFSNSAAVEGTLRSDYEWYQSLLGKQLPEKAEIAYQRYDIARNAAKQIYEANNKVAKGEAPNTKIARKLDDAVNALFSAADQSYEEISHSRKRIDSMVKSHTNRRFYNDIDSVWQQYKSCEASWLGSKCEKTGSQQLNYLFKKYFRMFFEGHGVSFKQFMCLRGCPDKGVNQGAIDWMLGYMYTNTQLSEGEINPYTIGSVGALMASSAFRKEFSERIQDEPLLRGFSLRKSGITKANVRNDMLKYMFTREVHEQTGGKQTWGYSLSLSSFINRTDVQSIFRKAMSNDYMPISSLEWSEPQFNQRYENTMKSYIIKQKMNDIKENVKDYSVGSERYDEGALYLKAMYIPPIAMMFSLFFSLLTIARIPKRYCQLMYIKTEKKGYLRCSQYLPVVMLLAVVVVPLLFNTPYTSAVSFKEIEGFLGHSMTFVQSKMLHWLLVNEPHMYSIGKHMTGLMLYK